MTWTTADVSSVLYTVVAVMLIVILYHVVFVVVDLRKAMRRVELVTRELEAVILKPLRMTDKALTWMIHHIEELGGKKKHKK